EVLALRPARAVGAHQPVGVVDPVGGRGDGCPVNGDGGDGDGARQLDLAGRAAAVDAPATRVVPDAVLDVDGVVRAALVGAPRVDQVDRVGLVERRQQGGVAGPQREGDGAELAAGQRVHG